MENLMLAFPERSPAERAAICRRSFQHLGMMLVELGLLLVGDPARMLARVTVEGLSHLPGHDGHGVLLLSAHLGNWELLGLAHALSGRPLAVVVRPLDSARLNRLAKRLRTRTGMELIPKRRALRAVLDALRRGRMVGILLDQNATRLDGVFVPFFGRLASTSRSLAVLALRTGTPIVPVFIHRERNGHHRIIVEPPIEGPVSLSGDGAIVELTAACSQRIEEAVRRRPEQWLWLHRRWRTRPIDEERVAR
jgi:KDO2-lipid IV(A) lauroyltransferase